MTISIVVTASPIPSHPDISVISETLESVRHHLPDDPIFLLFDGVRPEQEHRRADYHEHIARVLVQDFGLVQPVMFGAHRHQVGMLRHIINDLRTPLMLFVEHDTPLEREPIDWGACADMIHSGAADIIRFYHESSVPEPHKHLMRERQGQFLRTTQFSARPHLASVAYYKRVLRDCFSLDANTFCEDVLHGQAQVKPDKHKIFIYAPEGNMRRSYHLNGRGDDPKFENQLVF